MPVKQTHPAHKAALDPSSQTRAQATVLQLTAAFRADLSWRDPLGLESTQMSGVFTEGTLIDTPMGAVPIENLGAGDEISSFVNGTIAVQSCAVVPDRSVPLRVVRIRSGYLHATADLITLPHQLTRLDHWLSGVLFGTKFPFVAASRICLENKIEAIVKNNMRFYRINLGVSDAITANGVMCITYAPNSCNQDDRDNRTKNYAYKELTPEEVQQALEAGSFFRKLETKK